MTCVTVEVTLTGSAQPLNAVNSNALAEYPKIAGIRVEPDPANANVVKVINTTSAKTIKQIAKPSAADAELDALNLTPAVSENIYSLADYSLLGTNTQKANVTIWVY